MDHRLIPSGLWISVDPGEVHVGVTYWKDTEPVWAKEFAPDEFVDWLIAAIAEGRVEMIVYEIFLLYPGAEINRNQMGSTFATCELIGVMRHLCRRAGLPFVGYQASHHKAQYKNSQFKPPLKPHRAWKSYGHGSHTKDAENLGIYHLNHTHNKIFGSSSKAVYT